MNIVVLVKQVPDTWAERKLKDADGTLDRASVDGLINELDEYAIEEGLQIAEAQRAAGAACASVTVRFVPGIRSRSMRVPAIESSAGTSVTEAAMTISTAAIVASAAP